MDESGRVQIGDAVKTTPPHFDPGDILSLSGVIEPQNRRSSLLFANCTNIIVVSKGRPPEPICINASDIDREDLLFRRVRISGTLVDVRQDEIDPDFIQVVLDSSNRMTYAAAYSRFFDRSPDEMKTMIGATVSIEGILATPRGSRIHYRRYIEFQGEKSITLLKPPSEDQFRPPEIDDDRNRPPEAIIALGRRRATGLVLAVWNGDTILIRTTNGVPRKVTLISAPPDAGEWIEAVGYAETDLFHVNLSSAIWRKTAPLHAPPEEIADVDCRRLLADKSGNRKYNVTYHGKTVRLEGTLKDITSNGYKGRRMTVSSDGYSIAADIGHAAGAIDKIKVDSVISVTGVCIAETETWNRHSTLPHTRGIFIAVRSPDDIKVLKNPPWWTPARLTTVIGALVLMLIAILIWNASLRTLSERRGREIYRRRIAQTRSELRLDERTRLAAELHDHLAQNLTAISYQVAAAERSRSAAPEASARHIATAARMLGSSRAELRRCIWDLRSDALDEPNLTLAIRKTIGPITGDAEVDVDFPVPRKNLSDSVTHAVLSIIRELVSNAVNGGKAENISVKGELAEDTLRVSVADDGCGFDAGTAPGPDDGHFGLAGMQERIRRHGGEIEIVSAIGNGTTVTATLKP